MGVLRTKCVPYKFFFFFFNFKFIYLFREKERVSMIGVGIERDTERIPSRLLDVSAEPDEGLKDRVGERGDSNYEP